MRTVFLLSCLLLGYGYTVNAQPKNNATYSGYLKSGDVMPDVEASDISNYHSTTLRLSDFRGKLLILDFWGIKCSACITALPKMEALQKQFGGRIQIVMVTRNTTEEVERLKKKIAVLRNVRFPMINGDELISKQFSFRTVPTHVWIDEKGFVIQITSGWETTAENIDRYLKGEKVELPFKNEKMDFDPEVPLWLEGNGRQLKHFKYYSFITGQLEDSKSSVGPYFTYDSLKRITGIKGRNLAIIKFLQFVANKEGKFELELPAFTLLEFEGADQYAYPKNPAFYEEWARRNLFCYELKVMEERLQDHLFSLMRQDMERFFGLRSYLENREVDCWVLKAGEIKDKLKPKGKDLLFEMSPLHDLLRIKNVRLADVIRKLYITTWKKGVRFVDETNYTEPVALEMKGDLSDINVIRSNLAKYGIKLVQERRMVTMLIIKKLDKI